MVKQEHSHRRRNRGNVGCVVQSTCGDIRVRGTIAHLIDKYNTLASETSDRAEEEMFLQHAEHYTRVKINNKENENVG